MYRLAGLCLPAVIALDACRLLLQAARPAAQAEGATSPPTPVCTKPAVSVLGLMSVALAESDHAMGAANMYAWFTHNFGYFEHHKNPAAWKRQVRVGFTTVRVSPLVVQKALTGACSNS